MSHDKPYPAYKDSGSEWLGSIPAHWQVRRAKTLIATSANGVWGEDPKGDDNDILCIRVADFDRERLTVIDSPRTYRNIDPADAVSRRIEAGDLLLEKSGGGEKTLVGMTVQYRGEQAAVCSNFIEALRLVPAVDGRWANYVFAAMYFGRLNYRSIKQATGIQNIDSSQYFNEPIAVPGLQEQQAIRAALDREMARIDALIARKTRFIELLMEKRQVLILHAITKGLDPHVTMKDSETAWIGEVPAHWKVAQLGKVSVARCDGPFGSGLKSEHYTEEGVRVVRLQNIGWAQFHLGEGAYIDLMYWQRELGGNHEVLPGDVLIAGLGDENNVLGRACVAPDDLGDALVKADCYRFRLGDRADPGYVALALSVTARVECGFLATGATRDRLNLGLACARVIPLPPREEQTQIIRALLVQTSKLDLLAEKTQESITLLRERREGLINAAVTGKVDLREAST